jgi:hypothetical protein
MAPWMQVVVALGITALTPFANPPRLNLGYTLGAGGGAVMSESLALPAVGGAPAARLCHVLFGP